MTTPELDANAEPETSPQVLVRQLVELLDVQELDTDLHRGSCRIGGNGRVFGGQVIAQALTASMRSVDRGAVAHSLHAYFMRPGDEERPIVYRVERDFDGRSFSTRRVIALQRGQPILNMAASFQRPENGLSHQADMPAAPAPETLATDVEIFRREIEGSEVAGRIRNILGRVRAIEVRPVEVRSLLAPRPREGRIMNWIRAAAALPDDPDVHRAVLAYASDMGLLSASMLPHGRSFASRGMQVASLDHALWLHDEFRVDEWLLYVMDSPWSGGARGFTRGQIFRRDGRLVASVAQEGLIRSRDPG